MSIARSPPALGGVPVLANITEFGRTPLFTVEELGAAGVRLVLYPLSAFRAMNQAAATVYEALRTKGTQQSVTNLMQTRAELYDVLGYLALRAEARRPVCETERHGENTMNSPTSGVPFKPKKSVALSGVVAGNTALCSVGRSGNDLHYRGYDILDLAAHCEFEEVAHLLVHGALPTAAELAAYKAKLQSLRSLPAAVRTVLEALPATTHPMDVLRTGVSALGCALPEHESHNAGGARDIIDGLLASLDSMLLYWHHFAHHGRRIEVATDDDSIGGHFLHLLHGERPRASWVRAMHTSLILYAEHEFNASTFTARVMAGTGSDIYSAITGGIGALRGPKHGGANEFALCRPEDATRAPTKPSRTSCGASRPRRSSSASVIRSTPSPIRATR